MTAYFIVRAEVDEADRESFDRWYETEHLPDAKAAFDALSARRGWSDVTPGIHFAIYEFPTLERAREIANSDALKSMIVEFEREWQDRVPRTREVLEIKQSI